MLPVSPWLAGAGKHAASLLCRIVHDCRPRVTLNWRICERRRHYLTDFVVIDDVVWLMLKFYVVGSRSRRVNLLSGSIIAGLVGVNVVCRGMAEGSYRKSRAPDKALKQHQKNNGVRTPLKKFCEL